VHEDDAPIANVHDPALALALSLTEPDSSPTASPIAAQAELLPELIRVDVDDTKRNRDCDSAQHARDDHIAEYMTLVL